MYASAGGCSPPPRATGGRVSYTQNETQVSASSQASPPVDAATCLQLLEEDVRRDVSAARQRALLLQEEIDALMTRMAEAQASRGDALSDEDPVMQRVEEIRRRRQE